MFGEHFQLNETTLGIVEQIGMHMPGGFFIYKAEKPEELLYANRTVLDIFGCRDLDEFKKHTGYTFKGMLHPDDYAEATKSIDDQIEKNSDYMDHVEYRIIRRDGEIRWIDDFGHYTNTEAYGGIYYVFISDITEKRERMDTDRAIRSAVIEALSESYHTVWLINDVETGTFSLYRGDVEGNTIHGTPIRNALKELKYSQAKDHYIDSTVALSDRERLHQELSLENIAKRLKEKPQFFVNYLRIMGDGSERYFRIELAKVNMPNGRLGVVCGFKDVDDEIREEQAINEALKEGKRAEDENKRLIAEVENAAKLAELMGAVASLLTNMPAMSFSKDAETGRYLACNQSFAEYAHKGTPEGVIGHTDFELFDDETAAHFVEDDKKALSMDEPYIFFEDVPDAKGVMRNLQTTKMKFTDSDGRLCTLGMCVDVTEMTRIKSAEAEAKVKQQELEEKIALQEKLLEQSKSLREALQTAEEASKAKTNFLSNMSHEIRTPITAILGMNELIRRESNDKDVLEYSGNIERAGNSLLGIINDILDFSKIEAGRMELVNVDYSISELVSGVINLTFLRAEDKGILLKANIDPDIPAVLNGDELRIKQIMTNLLSNAVKYTERGSVTLTMKLVHEDNENADIFVSVADTGIGIKEEEREKLFSAFDRLDVIRTRSIEGTGLGLAITSQMLELMGSRLEVKSEYGKGSDFYFTVKQHIVDDEKVGSFDPMSAEYKGKNEAKEKNTYFVAPGAKVLIVDDTPLNLQVIVGLLKHTGVQTDTASSGAECIERFGKEEHYDMVFLDYRMPQMDGIETLNRLKELYPEKVKNTPIISLTASAVMGDREKMLNAGFNDYLSKPVNIPKLEDAMLKYLPKDKLRTIDADESFEDDEFLKLPAELFNIDGVDPRAGIEYCGDAEDYLEALEIYTASIEKKASDIENAAYKKDIDSFVIMVHSLKSTSKAVGAMKLSELALSLEQAGRNRDEAAVAEKTPELLFEYRELLKKLTPLF